MARLLRTVSTKFRGCYCARHLANERIKCNQFVKKLLARSQREGDVFKFLKDSREEREGRVQCRIQVHTIAALHRSRSKFLLNSKHKFRDKGGGGEGRNGGAVSRLRLPELTLDRDKIYLYSKFIAIAVFRAREPLNENV